MDSTRRHYAFRMNAERSVLNDEDLLCDVIVLSASEGGATILDVISHRFEPEGVTALALLAESHISIHTWPEERAAELDVFTCGDAIDPHSIGLDVIRKLDAEMVAAVLVDTSPL